MTDPRWAGAVREAAYSIRRRVLDHTIRHDGGYMSQACSAADILATLYLKVMNLAPVGRPLMPRPFPGVPSSTNSSYFTGAEFNGVPGAALDRFFLSPAHYALVLYAVLIEAGRMDARGLEPFNRDGSSVEMIGAEHSPGMEVTAGSLGQCLSQAAGVAMGRRLKRETGRTWVFMSDGEFQIGQTWEALQAIAFHRLGRVGIYVDMNGQQCDGRVASVMSVEPLHARLEAFGFRVYRVDGHDPEAIAAPAAFEPDARPLAVLCQTDPCRGLSLLRQNAPRLHYLRFTTAPERVAYRQALEVM